MPYEQNASTVILSPQQMSDAAVNAGAYKTNKKQYLSFFSAIASGIFIAMAFVFYVTTQTGASAENWGVTKFIGGLVFSIGIIMVVVCGTELFTSSTMSILARLEKRASVAKIARNWAIVYAGNLVGSLFIVALIWFGNQIMADHGQWGLTVLNTAQHKIHHQWFEAFSLGTLCNIMVCIAIWMAYSGKTLSDKVLISILPIALFVSSGFEHCIANMFMIPMGILVAHFASPEFWQHIGVDPSLYADLTVTNFIIKNLIPVTLGNIFGGSICIALLQWFLNRKNHLPL